MARHRIDELLRILDRSFDKSEHSLLRNLDNVTAMEWEALPDGAERTIRDIVHHVGLFKFMYANHGWRDASMDYGDNPATPPADRIATKEAAIEWLREAHAYVRSAVDTMQDDSELEQDRKAHWGDMVSTTVLVDIMHEHDVYHAGEINRTRGMLQGNDSWAVPTEE